MPTNINIRTIPHNTQRYETVGDYFYDDMGTLQVRISDMKSEIYEKMVIIHELIEEAISKYKGVTEQQITDFDLYFERRRGLGLVTEDAEAGFDANAPYRIEHTFATSVEMGICALCGIDWMEYSNFVNKLA